MKFVNAIITDQSIIMIFDTGAKICTSSHPCFKKVKSLIEKGKPMDALAEFDVTLKLKKHSSGKFFVDNGIVYMDNTNPIPMPTALSSRVIQFADAGLDFQPLINFFDNIQKNPSPESVKDLYAFLEHNGISITEDGCFCAYKGVERDYHSNFQGVWTKDSNGDFQYNANGHYDNTPGSRCEMPRDKVDDNREVTCSSGLHVASYSYANGFSSRTVLVKVDPADVVSVPTDYNGQKMRTCGYDVLKDVTEEVKAPLYTDDMDETSNDDFYDDNEDDFYDDNEDDAFYDGDANFYDDEAIDVDPSEFDAGDVDIEIEDSGPGIQTIVPDKSGRVCVPSAFVKSLGLKPSQIANIYLLSIGSSTKPTKPIKILANPIVNSDPDYQYVVDRDSNIRLSKTCVAASLILNEYSDIQVELEDGGIVLS